MLRSNPTRSFAGGMLADRISFEDVPESPVIIPVLRGGTEVADTVCRRLSPVNMPCDREFMACATYKLRNELQHEAPSIVTSLGIVRLYDGVMSVHRKDPSMRERAAMVAISRHGGAFVSGVDVIGRNVVLCDDFAITGSTLKALALCALANGAKTVTVWVPVIPRDVCRALLGMNRVSGLKAVLVPEIVRVTPLGITVRVEGAMSDMPIPMGRHCSSRKPGAS
jgi:hypothetical protein